VRCAPPPELRVDAESVEAEKGKKQVKEAGEAELTASSVDGSGFRQAWPPFRNRDAVTGRSLRYCRQLGE
jgi:hypothetical protein